MPDLVLSLDLGTGGCKSSLWSADGLCLADAVVNYDTLYPRPGWNEQRPAEWWEAAGTSVRTLLAHDAGHARRVAGIAISGHSLGVVALDDERELVFDTTPIWSDTRATALADRFFTRYPEADWYLRTGNGFTPALYPVFKTAWYAEHNAEAWSRVRLILGSKDYINLRLTGRAATDHSYASGSGAYDLVAGDYDDSILRAAGLDRELLPAIHASTDVLGAVLPEAASDLGLPAGVPVFVGGVDNSCMALGSRGDRDGRMYAALGSSSWMTCVTSSPVLDLHSRPYVFAHVVPGLFVSALSTFSSGTTMTWLHDLIAPDVEMAVFVADATREPLAETGLVFLPMLAGGTPLEGGASARGLVYGLGLSHNRRDIAQAAVEGITLALRRSLRGMAELTPLQSELLISGGGSKDPGWNQIYADALGLEVVRTAVDQQAAALGAAAIAFVGAGLWDDFTEVDRAHVEVARYRPDPCTEQRYERLARWWEAFLATTIEMRRVLSPSWSPHGSSSAISGSASSSE